MDQFRFLRLMILTLFNRKDEMILFTDNNSVSDQIASTIVFHENAMDAWDELREIFLKVGHVRICTLRYFNNNLKQN